MLKDLFQNSLRFNDNDRKIVRFLVITALLIVGSQILQFCNGKIIDYKYESILSKKNIIIQSSETCLIESATTHRMMLNLLLVSDSIEKDYIQNRTLSSIKKNDESLSIIINEASTLFSNDTTTFFSDIKNSNTSYKNNCNTFQRILNTEGKEKAKAYKNSTLRPAFEDYQKNHKQLLGKVLDNSTNKIHELSKFNAISRWVLFLTGLSPFIFLLYKILVAYFHTRKKAA